MCWLDKHDDQAVNDHDKNNVTLISEVKVSKTKSTTIEKMSHKEKKKMKKEVNLYITLYYLLADIIYKTGYCLHSLWEFWSFISILLLI